ncbi:unnamed protein product [Diamesa serratosioi]
MYNGRLYDESFIVKVKAIRDKDVHVQCQSNNELSFLHVTPMSLGHSKSLSIENCSITTALPLIILRMQYNPLKVHPPVHFYTNGQNNVYDSFDVGEILLNYVPFYKFVQDLFDNENQTLKVFLHKIMFNKSLMKQFSSDFEKFLIPFMNNNINVFKFESNNLKHLNAGTLSKLPKIDGLYFIKNKMKDLRSDIFASAFILKRIIFDGNDFSSVPSELLKSNSILTDFELHNSINSIKTLPENLFFNKTMLQSVLITNNGLEKIPHKIFHGIASIKNISLAMNKLLDVSVSIFAEQIELESLDLSQNKLTSIENGTFPNSMKLLNLSCNLIMNVNSDAFKGLQSLKELYLDNNKIDKLDSNIFKDLLSIQFIDLQNNQLSSQISLAQVVDMKLICEIKTKDCPDKCRCFDRPADNVMMVNCSNLQLTSVPNLPLLDHPSQYGFMYENTEIDITNNKINQLPSKSHQGYSKVSKIFGENNSISHLRIDEFPERLTTLDLRNNKLKTIDKTVVEKLNSIKHLSLMGNKWTCDCLLVDLMTYVKSDHKNVIDYNNWICDDKREFKKFHGPSDICFNTIYIIVIITIITTVFGLLAALYYRFKKQIKIWLYSRGLCLWFISEEELDEERDFDAFVVFAREDQSFVEDLVEGLENEPPHYKCCIHLRDWHVGEMIPTQIINSINDSRRIIIVLSKDFHLSRWAQWEFRVAQLTTFEEQRSRIIFVLLCDMKDLNLLDDELKSYLKLSNHIKANDPKYWKKLRKSMPFKKSEKLFNPKNDDKADLIKNSF